LPLLFSKENAADSTPVTFLPVITSVNHQNDRGRVTFRFYGELSFFLSASAAENAIPYFFNGKPSVKDAIEAQHVPHTEVGSIFIDETPVDFNAHLFDTQHIDVHPIISPVTTACPIRLSPPPQLRFVADVHLGRLTRYLRLLGFDVFYKRHFDDPDIIRCSLREQRTILTRDRRLLHIKDVTHGCCLHSQIATEQLHQLTVRYNLKENAQPFSRCPTCNGLLHDVGKQSVIDRLEPKTILHYDAFRQCDSCGKVFWKGSHMTMLEKVTHL
jgi:uncharacterized protein